MTPRPDRRTQILGTAARMFAVSGFHGVSVDDLGAELGISGPAIYRYFPGKEAILADMLVDVSRRLLDGSARRIAQQDSPEAQLEELLRFHVDFALAEPELIAVHFRDLGSAPAREQRLVRQLQRSYVGVWVEVLRRLHPEVPVERATSSVQAVLGLLNSTPYSLRGGEPHMADLLHDMARAALDAACSADHRERSLARTGGSR